MPQVKQDKVFWEDAVEFFMVMMMKSKNMGELDLTLDADKNLIYL